MITVSTAILKIVLQKQVSTNNKHHSLEAEYFLESVPKLEKS